MCPEVSISVVEPNEQNVVTSSSSRINGEGPSSTHNLGVSMVGRPSTSSVLMGGSLAPPNPIFGASALAAASGPALQPSMIAGSVPGPGLSVLPIQKESRFDEDVNLSLIKVVVLGAHGVGKSSLVKRFVTNDFPTQHIVSKKKSEYFPSLILNDSLFELKILDLPTIPFFPDNSEVEWSEYRYFGLRSASAYLLVYDASTPSTFHFIKALREQMIHSRDMTNVPVIVAANKMDLVQKVTPTVPASRSTDQSEKDRKEMVNMVKKSWRASHVECSAKYNWNVVNVFKELAVTLDMVANGQMIGPGSQGSVKKKRCLMF
ncbi:hypothetical protein TCAL_08921 [Tigriopus californicus]|uniref:Ras-like protein family member 10B n=1 Tax=Tigriopus californicus TaxID=6832 RepID=A0A553NY13_TIGCA|nr:ras-like protein family member 10B [Tigriopus californicus]XP_059091544.1 ras-like protein family member 10B [Tigriopus californicus]XP_059091545.1 ras-like protein family member 10B [Tigriopus californicus]XP_059091546.1 ras-like protein family member 10B [Tigriopus californicus]TRY70325.1 hypothetical protein TCAL_08921 [Tigriopus californicus]